MAPLVSVVKGGMEWRAELGDMRECAYATKGCQTPLSPLSRNEVRWPQPNRKEKTTP